WRRNRAAALPYLVLVCVFPLTYYITHPLMDYREPIEPAIIVLATAGSLSFSARDRQRLHLVYVRETASESINP
ncbi:MAG: hypothetical protein ACP5E2_14795, partial [Terracidiphilus sp.]